MEPTFVKTDDNTFVNEQHIVWMRQMNECLKIGTVQTGALCNTYKICNSTSPHSYNKLHSKMKDAETK